MMALRSTRSTDRASGIPHDGARSRRHAEDGRLSEDQGCRHRLGPKGSRDLLKSGDLRPQRLPYRAQAVVQVSRSGHDRRAAEGASKIIYRDPPTSTKLLRVNLWVGPPFLYLRYCYY